MSQAPLLLLLVIPCSAALVASGASLLPPAPAPRPGPNCPTKCGDVHIPYPFGVGTECSFPGFAVTCDETTSPPSLFTGNLEIANITLEKAQMIGYVPLTYTCQVPVSKGRINKTTKSMALRFAPQFLISPTDNVFTSLGCSSIAVLQGRVQGRDRYQGSPSTRRAYPTGCISACASVDETGEDGAPCRGYGCCEAPLTPGLNQVSLDWNRGSLGGTDNWCQYAFVSAKGWYKYSRKDLIGNMTFSNRLGPRDVIPLVLDWAIRNGSCPPSDSDKESVPYGACISTHSKCVNASSGALGYFCNCSRGYAGNPYILDGCTNTNECERKDLFPCSGGTCHDEIGDYKCICHFGRRGDGKSPDGCEAILPTAAVAVIGTTSAMALLAVLLIFLHMNREKRKLRDHFNKNGGQLLKSIQIEIFTQEKLKHITENYRSFIGKGAFGNVYKGTTENNTHVAVKCSIPINMDRQKDFFVNEITIQSKMSHRNLVQLLGCCLETEVPMLVYEFVPRGSLHDVLHDKRDPLLLETRIDIAINSADALAYMHSQASQKILHGDVKSGNILLDDGFMPKVSDFGTSRLMSIDKDHTNWVIGDNSYIDPVYIKTGLLTEKSDVYSFGIVLLELITRKKARYDKNNSLPINYLKASTNGTTKEMYDADIIVSGAEEDMKCLEEVGMVAVHCLAEDVNDRPTMNEVADELKMCKSRWLQSHDQASELCT